MCKVSVYKSALIFLCENTVVCMFALGLLSSNVLFYPKIIGMK
jgi:hypothetical protein